MGQKKYRRPEYFESYVDFQQFLEARKAFEKKDEKKEDKKHWTIEHKRTLQIYALMILTYPLVGKLYMLLLAAIWNIK